MQKSLNFFGTVILGIILLWERLNDDNPSKKEIYDFLTCEQSPIKWIIHKLGNQELIAGCGPLTIVCTTEILKTARMIAGIDHISGEIKPILPEGRTGFEAEGFPVIRDGKTEFYDIKYSTEDGVIFTKSA